MKKNVLITVVALLMLAFTATMVSAGQNSGNHGKGHYSPMDQTNLTDAQKQEMAPLLDKMKDLHSQMFEVHKQMIQKQVSFGTITQEEADKQIAMMQERMEKGPGMGHGTMGHGSGMMPGGPRCQQTPNDK